MAAELTVFALPKPFRDEFDVIQRNAIGSWARLPVPATIVLFGDEAGTAEAAASVGAAHLTDVARSEHGTPFVGDLFRRAEEAGGTEWLVYVNADVVLLDDFADAVRRLRRRLDRFLMVGRRWDLEIAEPIAFDEGWQDRVRRDVEERGVPHAYTGIDYFVFPKEMWGDIPPFAIGRFAWDNWLLWRARELRVPLVDASSAVMAVHQDHPVSAPGSADSAVRESERVANVRLAGDIAAYYTLDDASHLLTSRGRLLPAWTQRHLGRRARRMLLELDRTAPRLARLIRRALAARRRLLS